MTAKQTMSKPSFKQEDKIRSNHKTSRKINTRTRRINRNNKIQRRINNKNKTGTSKLMAKHKGRKIGKVKGRGHRALCSPGRPIVDTYPKTVTL